MTNNMITEEKLHKYFALTKEALEMVESSPMDPSRMKEAEDLLDLSKRYYQDALYFEKKGEMVLAFSAVNYAHCFLDAGARLGIFKVKDSRLFMVDD